MEFIIDELAYAFESDPVFNENELRNAVYEKEAQPTRAETKTKPELIDRAPLLKKLAVEFKEALDDCWGYHESELKEGEPKLKKSELANFLYDVELTGWDDVGFFIGYLRGIDNAVELLSEAKPQRETLSAQTRNKIKST